MVTGRGRLLSEIVKGNFVQMSLGYLREEHLVDFSLLLCLFRSERLHSLLFSQLFGLKPVGLCRIKVSLKSKLILNEKTLNVVNHIAQTNLFLNFNFSVSTRAVIGQYSTLRPAKI